MKGIKNILSPEEQFEVAKDNYKPNSRYNGLTSFPIMMFSGNDTLEDKINKLIEWSFSINEKELARNLEDMLKTHKGVKRELERNIKIYETDDYHYLDAAKVINILCHVQGKSANEYLRSEYVDIDRERELGIE